MSLHFEKFILDNLGQLYLWKFAILQYYHITQLFNGSVWAYLSAAPVSNPEYKIYTCQCYVIAISIELLNEQKEVGIAHLKTIHSSYESQKIFRLIQYFKWYQNFQKIFVTKFHPNYKMTKCFCNNVDLCRILAFGMTSQTYQTFY